MFSLRLKKLRPIGPCSCARTIATHVKHVGPCRLEMGIRSTFQQMRDIMSCTSTTSRKTETPVEGGPEWKPDEFVKCCGMEFSLFLRKHHCRSCGGVATVFPDTHDPQ